MPLLVVFFKQIFLSRIISFIDSRESSGEWQVSTKIGVKKIKNILVNEIIIKMTHQ